MLVLLRYLHVISSNVYPGVCVYQFWWRMLFKRSSCDLYIGSCLFNLPFYFLKYKMTYITVIYLISFVGNRNWSPTNQGIAKHGPWIYQKWGQVSGSGKHCPPSCHASHEHYVRFLLTLQLLWIKRLKLFWVLLLTIICWRSTLLTPW
jgi:hypothetical protein